MTDPQIVCLGAGSEYALRPLAVEARRRGCDVVEIDMYEAGWREGRLPLIRHPFVLVTSHHPYLDAWAHIRGFGRPADVESLTEFVARERPTRTIYIPHDLSDHLHTEEFNAFHLFDALLMPNECHWFARQHVRVENVGWIKAASSDILATAPLTFMPSEVPYYINNRELFSQRFESVLVRRPRFKVPVFPESETLAAIAERSGCEIVPAAVDSTALLHASLVVVSNGLSSIVSESAALGLPTLCVVDGVHPFSDQSSRFANMPPVALRQPDRCGSWIDAALAKPVGAGKRGRQMSAFDFERALSVILYG